MQTEDVNSQNKRFIYTRSPDQDLNGTKGSPKIGDYFRISSNRVADSSTDERNLNNEIDNKLQQLKIFDDSTTQTSKTILDLAHEEYGEISPDSLNTTPKSQREAMQDEETQTPRDTSSTKATDQLTSNRSLFLQQTSPLRKLMSNQVVTTKFNTLKPPKEYRSDMAVQKINKMFQLNTSVDQNIDIRGDVAKPQKLKRAKSILSRKTDEIVVLPPLSRKTILNEACIDSLSLDLKISNEATNDGFERVTNTSCDTQITSIVGKLKEKEWDVCLKALADLVDLCKKVDVEMIHPHMTVVNQRLIELLGSPRSHVCRLACQAAGHFFETVRDTRRPEFDAIVNLLLQKTADSNKFIRQDANLSLDCMVTNVAYTHSVRALCSSGPTHKNSLVRVATARLVVCAVVIGGATNVLNPVSSEYIRKMIFLNLPKFIEDKCLDVRKFGERLYKLLSKEKRFDQYLKKYLDVEGITKLSSNLRNLTFKI